MGTRIRNGPAWLFRGTPANPTDAAQRSSAATPYWLLWSTGIIAAVLCAVAFVLWGRDGAGILFDMIIALCT